MEEATLSWKEDATGMLLMLLMLLEKDVYKVISAKQKSGIPHLENLPSPKSCSVLKKWRPQGKGDRQTESCTLCPSSCLQKSSTEM
ncbi:hypothetical protein HispidOSU_021772, partial [Sigmodon hispidus]